MIDGNFFIEIDRILSVGSKVEERQDIDHLLARRKKVRARTQLKRHEKPVVSVGHKYTFREETSSKVERVRI